MSWGASDWPPADELAAIRADAMAFAGVGLYRYLLDGTVIFLDQGAFDLLDLEEEFPDPGAVLGKNISELFVPVLSPGVLRAAINERGEVRGFEYPYRTLSGKERWVYHCAYPVTDPDSGLAAVQVISQDITAIKLAARALAASERQYRSLAEQSLQGLIVLQGTPPSLRFVNGAALELIGCSREVLEGEGLGGLFRRFHPEDHGWWAEQLQALEDQQLQVVRRDLRLVREGALVRWLIALSGPIEYEGRYALQAVLVDDTERRRSQERQRQLEDRMRQAQKLESLGVLAGGIAHDFNNLLAAIQGNAELAVASLAPGSPARVRLERIGRAATRATELCQQLLAYSGRGRFSMEVLDLRALILDTAELLHVSIASSIRLSYCFEESLPPIVADAAQLRQVFMNLLTNASEAVEASREGSGPAGGGGSVRFTARSCRLDDRFLEEHAAGEAVTPGTFVRVEVEDDGVGMSPEMVGQIFEPFYTTKFAGRGLGLAAVKGIVSGHGGLVQVTSQPGSGTRLSCYFPASEAAVPPPEPRAAAGGTAGTVGRPGGSGTVLVVDDDPEVRAMATEVLDLLGFDTREADGGEEALRLLREGALRPCAVLLDLTMPGIGGYETFQLLRALRPDLPILFSSGFDQRSLPIDLRIEQAVGFLKKPYGIRELEAALAPLLG